MWLKNCGHLVLQCYDNHFEEFEWFLKADDDTFVIVENLKYLLSNYSTNDPIHFGHHYKYMGVSRGLNIDRSFNQYPRSEKTILMLSGSAEANFSLLFWKPSGWSRSDTNLLFQQLSISFFINLLVPWRFKKCTRVNVYSFYIIRAIFLAVRALFCPGSRLGGLWKKG